MTKRDRKALGRYIRWVADHLELWDWTFRISDETTGEEHVLAEVRPAEGRKLADIIFCADFRDRAREEQRHTVAHELVHCHFAAVQHQVEEDLDELLGKPADAVLCSSFRRN